MNKTTIDWPGLTNTINPVSGCLRNCNKESSGFDCYACELHTVRHTAYLAGKKLPDKYKHPFNEMHFYPACLDRAPKKSRVIKKVFVGSMSDICYWMPEWLAKTIQFCRDRPEMEFMFLTKSPTVYTQHCFPENCWLGVTITGLRRAKIYSTAINMLRLPNRKFISIEPLLGSLNLFRFSFADLVIVGADSSKNPVIPKKEWIESIKHPNIFYKENIKKYL